jgi:ABC-2 type transport system permease protein
MNIFWREIKYYKKGLLFWSLGMALLIWSSMIKYSTFQTAGQSVTDLISKFPQSIQTIFGLTGFDLTKASGFYGVMFMYIVLMVTIHAAMLGAGIMSKEERDRTSEFIFVKPVTRNKVITAKIMAGLVGLIAFNIVTLLSSILFINLYSHTLDFINDIYMLMAGLFFMQLIFFFIGTATAAISKKPKLSASIASAVLLVTFILTYLISFNNDLDYLKYLTPFKYFDAKDILAHHSLDIVYMSLSLVIVAVTTLVTYVSYNNRDLEV